MTKARMLVLTFLALLLAGGLTSRVHAAAVVLTHCPVTKVGTDGRLFVTCGGMDFVGLTGATTCNAVSVDTLKMWTALLSSALLSGKPVNITYENAAGACMGVLYSIDLFSN